MTLGRAKLVLPGQVPVLSPPSIFIFFFHVSLHITYVGSGTQQTCFVSSNVSNISTILENKPSKRNSPWFLLD